MRRNLSFRLHGEAPLQYSWAFPARLVCNKQKRQGSSEDSCVTHGNHFMKKLTHPDGDLTVRISARFCRQVCSAPSIVCRIAFLTTLLMATGLSPRPATAQDTSVFEAGQLPNDSRLQPRKDLNGYFPFEVPQGKAAWEARATELRRQTLIATGLWPMPEKTPLNAVVHCKFGRPGFTVEKVYFESVPNHFVTGLLFRPDDGMENVKRPAVLCPHGHGGRLQDYGEKKIRQLIADGA